MPAFPGEGLKRRVAQKLDFEDDRTAHRLNLIETSTTDTPGKQQRSVLSERKLMKMEVGAQQGISLENINANLYVRLEKLVKKSHQLAVEKLLLLPYKKPNVRKVYPLHMIGKHEPFLVQVI